MRTREEQDTTAWRLLAARLAIDVYAHQLRREIAAMTAAMNGLDVLVFTGGIGKHSPVIRAERLGPAARLPGAS